MVNPLWRPRVSNFARTVKLPVLALTTVLVLVSTLLCWQPASNHGVEHHINATPALEVPQLSVELTSVLSLGLNWFWIETKISEVESEFGSRGVQHVHLKDDFIQNLQAQEPLPTDFALVDNLAIQYTNQTFRGYNLWNEMALATLCRNLGVQPFDIYNDPLRFEVAIKAEFQSLSRQLVIAERLLSKHNPQLVLYVQGYVGSTGPFRAVAKRKRITTLSLENSMHKDRLVWDCETGISTQSTQVKSVYGLLNVTIHKSTNVINDYFENVGKLKMGQHSAARSNSTETKLPGLDRKRKTVLFLGQVYNDAAVVFGLHEAFRSSSHLIQELTSIVSRMKDANLVVRLHPKECLEDKTRLTTKQMELHVQSKAVKDYRHLFEEDPTKFVLDDCRKYDTYDLIRDADLVVTINSQAGLEAAALGKPLILTGRALYGGMGFSKEVRNVDELRSAIASGISKSREISVEAHAIAIKLTYVFLFKYSIPRKAVDIADLAAWAVEGCCGKNIWRNSLF
jgi:hypothetical protein